MIRNNAYCELLPLSSLCFLPELLLPARGALLQVPFVLRLEWSKVKKKVQDQNFTGGRSKVQMRSVSVCYNQHSTS